ncbi:virion core protein, T7 gp14 family [Desulfovibrio litoralis]|uniref:Uncharacterized protein n=1 Tax=Desulfovibrio litoralis DSM 11393 TaxID=1121455 RepID=A0A1M7SWH7_9BACT|nr:hypothetical protein [Desulfovibrio litoralis]SHN62863.1 hypothetical protein SAMN02745728_01310 [Desulfovibrio litoralis DSM 11393]
MCTELMNIPFGILQGYGNIKQHQIQDRRTKELRSLELERELSQERDQLKQITDKATETEYEASKQKENLKRNASRQEGAARSLLSASGVVMNTGSAKDLLADNENELTRTLADLDYENQKKQKEYQYQANKVREQSNYFKQRFDITAPTSTEQNLSFINTLATSANSFSKSIGGINSLL